MSGSTYSSNPKVVIAHNKSSPLIVFLFSLWHLSEASPVMKLINSDTHSCTVSLASFEILAFAGNAFFMILLTFAIGRNLSCSLADNSLFALLLLLCPPESLSESAIPKLNQLSFDLQTSKAFLGLIQFNPNGPKIQQLSAKNYYGSDKVSDKKAKKKKKDKTKIHNFTP